MHRPLPILIPSTKRNLRYLIASSKLVCWKFVDFVATHRPVMLSLILRIFIPFQIRPAVFFLLLLPLLIVYGNLFSLLAITINRNSRQTLIPLNPSLLSHRNLTMATWYRWSIIIWFRQLILNTFQLAWGDTDCAQHISLRSLVIKTMLDLLFDILWQIFLKLFHL